MNKNLKNLLLNFDLTELEINDLVQEAPIIEEISCEEFLKNCKILVDFGYPEEDLDSIILANPNLFLRSSEQLQRELAELSKHCEDIEVALKQDPFII